MSTFALRRTGWLLAGLPLLLACSLVSQPPRPGTPALPSITVEPGSSSMPPTDTPTPDVSTPEPTQGMSYTDISSEQLRGVIVPADRAAEFGIFQASAYWTPTDADVAAFEAAFPAWIADQSVWGADEVTERWPEDYIRQYVGFERDEQRLLYVNAFCELDFVDWHDQPVSVDDGGPCFFSVVYDPQTGLFSELMINGIA